MIKLIDSPLHSISIFLFKFLYPLTGKTTYQLGAYELESP